jgi:eukaryotic-like serine/threonine-protein kinase
VLALPPRLPAQDAQDIQRLKGQIEALERENELFRQQIELLMQVGSLKGAGKQADTKREELVINLGNGVKMEFIHIKAGTFLMGSPDSDKDAAADEKPQHRVKITKDFYLAKYPVTQEQFLVVMGKNPSQFSSKYFKAQKGMIVDTRRFPVDSVSWDDAIAFCGELRARDKVRRLYGLPTEAEFEFAQRAGTTTRYSFGDDPDDLSAYAWFNGNSDKTTHPVGTKKPNPWGLYDMDGNIRQWCSDRFGAGYYAMSPLEDPKGPDSGDLRVMRANHWGLVKRGDSAAVGCRSASRVGNRGAFRENMDGFRVCIHLE